MNFLKTWFKNKHKGDPDQIDKPVQASLWSIGIYKGDSIFNLEDPGPGINPVLTVNDIKDYETLLVADPFMIRQADLWYLFFEMEVKTPKGNIGKIGLAVSKDGLDWTYEKVVLEESFHLSYPYVFKWNNQIYMIPETRSDRSIRLYRAAHFPYEWSFEKKLLKGRRFADNSLFFHNDHWWMFTDAGNHTLRLYYSDRPDGKWKEHKKSPVLKKQPSFARPGGRVVVIDGCPVRFAQDAYPVYGSQVWAFQIVELTPKNYKEIPIQKPVIKGSGSGWNKTGMHTLDAHKLQDGSFLACVDGLETRQAG